MSELKFIDACLVGEALLDDIDDYVGAWHDSDSEEEIYEFLGMTLDEYGVWVENDYMLKTILHCRNKNIDINDFISLENQETLVARASSSEEAAAVKVWLQRRLNGSK